MSFAPAALVLIFAILWPWLGLIPVARWHGDLRAAAEAVQPLATVRERLDRVQEGITPDGDTQMRIAEDVARMVGNPPPRSREAFIRNLDELLFRATGGAQVHLESAAARAPGHFQTTEALVRTLRLRATAAQGLGRPDQARALGLAAHRAINTHLETGESAAAMGLLGNVLVERAELENDPAWYSHAILAWEAAAHHDPHGLTFPWRTLRLLDQLGRLDTPEARQTATLVLDLDSQLRLDPLKQLTPAERDWVKGILQQ